MFVFHVHRCLLEPSLFFLVPDTTHLLQQAACTSAPKGVDPDVIAIGQRLKDVKRKILVLSGKGGVGKSTFAAQLAYGLAERGRDVGLLDIDICGPSAPIMFGQEGQDVHKSNSGWSPVYVRENLSVMSIGFLLPNQDDAVISAWTEKKWAHQTVSERYRLGTAGLLGGGCATWHL